MTDSLETRVADLEAAVLELSATRDLEFVGDLPGHAFRGNQYSGGGGSEGAGGPGKSSVDYPSINSNVNARATAAQIAGKKPYDAGPPPVGKFRDLGHNPDVPVVDSASHAGKNYSGQSAGGYAGHDEQRSPVVSAGRINPSDPKHEFLDGNTDDLQILKDGDTGKLTAVAGKFWNVGDQVGLMNDQSRRQLGSQTQYVVGTRLAGGASEGIIPTQSVPVRVFK